MKFKLYLIPILILAIIFGGIGLANVAGWWQPYAKRTSGSFSGGGEVINDISDPYDIRSSYTFEDVERNFDMSVELLAEAFPVSDKDFENIMLQDIESYYEKYNFPYHIGTGSFKYFIALYKNLPFNGKEPLPDTAVNILERDGKIAPGSIIGLKTDKVYDGGELNIEVDEGEFSISGDTTVKEALEHGIKLEELEAIIGKVDDENSLIKTVLTENGFTFGKLKDSLNELTN